MKFVQEFKTFAVKGNVVDMAVGIVIGAAFGKIVTSFVSDVIMPPIGFLVGGVDFSNLVLTLKPAEGTLAPVVLSYGKFIQTLVDFTIVAFALFILIQGINKLRTVTEKKAAEAAVAVPPAPSKEEQLLTEIRDLLKHH